MITPSSAISHPRFEAIFCDTRVAGASPFNGLSLNCDGGERARCHGPGGGSPRAPQGSPNISTHPANPDHRSPELTNRERRTGMFGRAGAARPGIQFPGRGAVRTSRSTSAQGRRGPGEVWSGRWLCFRHFSLTGRFAFKGAFPQVRKVCRAAGRQPNPRRRATATGGRLPVLKQARDRAKRFLCRPRESGGLPGFGPGAGPIPMGGKRATAPGRPCGDAIARSFKERSSPGRRFRGQA